MSHHNYTVIVKISLELLNESINTLHYSITCLRLSTVGIDIYQCSTLQAFRSSKKVSFLINM